MMTAVKGSLLERRFRFAEHGTTLACDTMAGVTTFVVWAGVRPTPCVHRPTPPSGAPRKRTMKFGPCLRAARPYGASEERTADTNGARLRGSGRPIGGSGG